MKNNFSPFHIGWLYALLEMEFIIDTFLKNNLMLCLNHHFELFSQKI